MCACVYLFWLSSCCVKQFCKSSRISVSDLLPSAASQSRSLLFLVCVCVCVCVTVYLCISVSPTCAFVYMCVWVCTTASLYFSLSLSPYTSPKRGNKCVYVCLSLFVGEFMRRYMDPSYNAPLDGGGAKLLRMYTRKCICAYL